MRWALFLVLCGCSEAVTHPCASQVTKGPWVERVDASHATIFWESANRGCVEAEVDKRVVSGSAVETHVVGEFGRGQPKPDEPGTYYRNEIALDGLTAGTCVDYRVKASQPAGDLVGKFCTARSPGADFTFLATADTDPILGHTLPTLMKVLPEMPDFTVHAGDMQYYSAIAETWAYWFGAMAPLLRSGPIYAAVGNHESELATEFDDYYNRLFARPTPEMTAPWFHFSSGGVYFFALDSENSSLDAGSEQVTWLENSLAAARAEAGYRFGVVYFHRPLYTVGDTAPQLDARAVLEPIFVDNGVKLVIQGHMHGYERFEVPNGLTYVTCAGGGGVINDVNGNVGAYPDDAALRVASSDRYHMCLYYVSAGKLSSKVVSEDGETLDSFEKVVP